ncbi:MAG: DNA alkylation repair protein [Deltaproteobacteria bacterium]|nr:DNA alkylation repair protein [Deltaproteobacteria bacterium]
MDVATLLHHLLAELTDRADPERAVGAKAYLKSDLRFLGVAVPDLREATLRHCQTAGKLDARQLREFAELCWQSDLHEARGAACVVLEKWPSRLGPDDLGWLEALLRRSFTWAYVDVLAVHTVGSIVARHPAAAKAVLARWAEDPDFWVRRTALLALLGETRHKKPFDTASFELWAVPLLGDREFFIRKAIGWVLRDVSKRDPAWVQGFLQRHRAAMAGLTLREASKYLPTG